MNFPFPIDSYEAMMVKAGIPSSQYKVIRENGQWIEIRKPGKALTVYSADSIKPALDEAVTAYQRLSGVQVKVVYCKVKQAFERTKQEKGDLFLSGHGDAYEAAKKEGLAVEGSQQLLGYLRVVLAVRKGNPLGIMQLTDLTRTGLKVGLGDPDTAQLGKVSEELLQKAGLADGVHADVVARGDCCSTTAALLIANKLEAELGWAAFSAWAPDAIDTIALPTDLAKPLPLTGLVLTTSTVPAHAAAFLRFLSDPAGKAIFAKFGYGPGPDTAAP